MSNFTDSSIAHYSYLISLNCRLFCRKNFFNYRRGNTFIHFFFRKGNTFIHFFFLRYFYICRIYNRNSIIYPYVFFGPGVKIDSDARVGPFAKCENTTIGNGVTVGNFVEIKASDIGINTKIKHLSYIGNTQVGQGSNIGAGTVICNYDGKKKHKTNIGNNCFIGANSSLIAPLNVLYDSLVAAGSVIVEDVPKRSLAIARERQITKKIK
ncbi:Bifunctional protein GlmU [Wolbachia endosymbiont of Armadillidium vulgare]|nr:Bifunctional protein GlmU [Wolbachia endosymbiont of Armadillidium vulgare]